MGRGGARGGSGGAGGHRVEVAGGPAGSGARRVRGCGRAAGSSHPGALGVSLDSPREERRGRARPHARAQPGFIGIWA